MTATAASKTHQKVMLIGDGAVGSIIGRLTPVILVDQKLVFFSSTGIAVVDSFCAIFKRSFL